MTSTTTRIVLVDDHPIVRSGIATLFSLDQDLEVVGEAGSVAEGKEVIAVQNPDVAILDLRLPDGPGLDVARWIAEQSLFNASRVGTPLEQLVSFFRPSKSEGKFVPSHVNFPVA